MPAGYHNAALAIITGIDVETLRSHPAGYKFVFSVPVSNNNYTRYLQGKTYEATKTGGGFWFLQEIPSRMPQRR